MELSEYRIRDFTTTVVAVQQGYKLGSIGRKESGSLRNPCQFQERAKGFQIFASQVRMPPWIKREERKRISFNHTGARPHGHERRTTTSRHVSSCNSVQLTFPFVACNQAST